MDFADVARGDVGKVKGVKLFGEKKDQKDKRF